MNTAGESASFSDSAYVSSGCIVLPREQIYVQADILTKIRPPDDLEVPLLSKKTLVSMISPGINTELYSELTKHETNVFALDCVPRMLSRAQAYDVLSSQANIAGYRAVIEAANNFPRFFAGVCRVRCYVLINFTFFSSLTLCLYHRRPNDGSGKSSSC